MLGFDHRRNGRVDRHIGFGGGIQQRLAHADGSFAGVDGPLAIFHHQVVVDHADSLAPIAGHDSGHTVEGSLDLVYARGAAGAGGTGSVGKLAVRVTHQNAVNARHFGQVIVGVFHGGAVGAGVPAAV